ncbi:cupredoxin domain-containing protein [Arthrobacter dokdonensis]|uniref:hypothetical protein n=1 Tax=Arthrobacter dokdonellae TaxID=2211210 RepID=UPI000DE57C23|nr:hypothetical protein [Arthrobacter dokdonellae]
MSKHNKLVAAVALAAMLGLGGCSTAAPAGSEPATAGSAAASGQPGSGMAGQPASDMAASGDAMAGMIHIESGHYRNAAPVAAGSMVTVMNMGNAAYTVTSDDGHSFSVTVPAGAMASFEAPGKAGSYPFHSDGRSAMHGVLTVH